MNLIFLFIVLIAFVSAGWRQLVGVSLEGKPSPMEQLSSGMVESAAGAVELAIGLVGVMTLFLGLMKVAEAGGLLKIIARLIRPLMVRLFPDVPAEHPAMGAMILNLSANVMGLGNAATPFGIRAMQELNKLNPSPGTATDAKASARAGGLNLLLRRSIDNPGRSVYHSDDLETLDARGLTGRSGRAGAALALARRNVLEWVRRCARHRRLRQSRQQRVRRGRASPGRCGRGPAPLGRLLPERDRGRRRARIDGRGLRAGRERDL